VGIQAFSGPSKRPILEPVHGSQATFLGVRERDILSQSEAIITASHAVSADSIGVGFWNAPLSALSPIIGRDADLLSAQNLLLSDAVRLLTLVGPGGVGKTRLALELAKNAAPHFADGAWFVDLSELSDAARISEAIARALGLRDAQQPAELLLEYHLRPRRALLVLDNLEHLPGAAAIVAALLVSSPNVCIITTSREALRLHGEQRFALAPLALPDSLGELNLADLEASGAVQLFLERARRAAPDFALNGENAATVAQLCARLDGLPLALELVAARADVFSPELMLERLERGEPLVPSGAADVPERHRSLEAALGWSYALLSAEDQAFLRRLAVFEGGWSVEAAARVADTAALSSDAFARLVALTDRSLVRSVGSQREPRFAFLKTMRAFALAQLEASGELSATATRHANEMLQLVERAESELRGPDQALWLERLENEFDNVRAALSWAAVHSTELGLRLSGALWRFWDVRGYRSEGRRWLEGFLATQNDSVDAAPTPARVKALLAAGALALSAADLSKASLHLERARTGAECLEDRGLIAEMLTSLATVAYMHFDRERAEALYAQALEIKSALGDRHGTADLLVSLGMVWRDQGQLERAQGSVEEGLRIHRAVGNLAGIASSLLRFGSVMIDLERLSEAAALFEESRAMFERLGQAQGAAAALIGLGEIARQRGDPRGAATPWAESLRLLYKIGQPYGLSWCLEALGELALTSEQPLVALRLFEASAALRETVGIPDDPDASAAHVQFSAQLNAVLGREALEAARQSAQNVPLGEAVREAREFAAGLNARETTKSDVTRGGLELSGRESEVLGLVAKGLSNKRIARALGVSDHTVKFHLTSVFNKLGCRTRAQATSIAAERGLLGVETAQRSG
jgi:predicted ATPase/DNA-binding CsgD family transcriptional regulator